MVCTKHDTHLDEAGSVFGKLALKPKEANDIAHVVVSGDQCAHGHSVVGWLLASVIADTADYSRWHPHLQWILNLSKRINCRRMVAW